MPRAPALRGAVAALLLLGASAAAFADNRPTVVFVLPSAAGDRVLAALPRALGAHLTGIGVQLVLALEQELPENSSDPLLDRARREGTLGLFVLDTDAPGRWRLYLTDPTSERWLARTIEVGADEGAAVESVALIVRRATQALAERLVPEMEPAGPPAAAGPTPPPPVPAPPLEARTSADTVPPPAGAALRLGVAYRRATFASEVRWLEGLDLSVAVLTAAGWVGALGYTQQAPVTVESGAGRLTIRHLPLRAGLGHRTIRGALSVEGEVSVALDVLTRTAGPGAMGLTATGDRTRLSWAVGAAARGELHLARRVGLFLLAGVDGYFNHFAYVADDGANRQTLLAPRWWRLRAVTGLSVGLP